MTAESFLSEVETPTKMNSNGLARKCNARITQFTARVRTLGSWAKHEIVIAARKGWTNMLQYHAAYYPIEDGWFLAKVLDFPGALSQGKSLKSARRMIRDSLEGLIQYYLREGMQLPKPKMMNDKRAEFQELLTIKVRCLKETHEKAKASSASSPARVRL